MYDDHNDGLKAATKKVKTWVKDASVKGGGFWRNAKKAVKSLDTPRNRTVAAVSVGAAGAIAANAYKGRLNKKNADESEVPASKQTVTVIPKGEGSRPKRRSLDDEEREAVGRKIDVAMGRKR